MAPQHNIRSYHEILQDRVFISDKEWRYSVKSLPSAMHSNESAVVKSIALNTKEHRHQLQISFVPLSPSRAVSNYPLDRFVLMSFANFRSLHNQTSAVVGTQPATPRECSDYVVKLLRAGVSINGTHYNFYGHSNSQLKSRTCFLFGAEKDEITSMVDALGDFSKMKLVQKKAKRLGLLFSTARSAMTINPSRCEDIPDIERDGYIFTDGCGLIAPRLAQELARRIGITFRNMRYTPSVFQIRYRGYKGVVTLDPRMRETEILLKFRQSMQKLKSVDDHSFAVIEHSGVSPLLVFSRRSKSRC